jgi:hypothetical protein
MDDEILFGGVGNAVYPVLEGVGWAPSSWEAAQVGAELGLGCGRRTAACGAVKNSPRVSHKIN